MTNGSFDAHDLLDGLTFEQHEAVMSHDRRLLVRATAGSGKTHVLTLRIQRRIESGELDPAHILVMTFTRKAGDELRTRLFRRGIRDIRAGTFHRAALSIVTQYRADANLRPLTIETSRRRLLHLLIPHLREDGMAIEDWQIPRIEQELSWALSQGFSGTTYVRRAQRHRRSTVLAPAQMAEVIDRYGGYCAARGVVDFDLLLQNAIQILRENPATVAGFRHRTRAFFVDETQDMNPLQFQLLKTMAGDDPDLFCVGDPNQSIYGFNGADPQLLSEVVRTWPDITVLDLTRNHRSTEPIVAVANTLLDDGTTGITPARLDGPLPLVRGYDTDEEEARRVVQWLLTQRTPGTSWRHMAILARTNAQLDPFIAALEEAGIPFEKKGGDYSPASDLAGGDIAPRVSNEDAVALSTIHRAKGLEWRCVAAVGWAEGQLPHYSAESPEQLAEEQRLAYVALTRAEEALLITWNQGRHDPRYGNRLPSRYLPAIEAVLANFQAQRAPLTGDARRARLAEARAAIEKAIGGSVDPQ